MKYSFILIVLLASCVGYKMDDLTDKKLVKLITLDPGHFHAALVQKSMYPEADTVVHVYAPEGPDVNMHLNRVEGFNTRKDNPTHWKQEVYTGHDFFEKMLQEKSGNVVVISGNNERKTDFIKQSLQGGFHVLADKPMVIDHKDFDALKDAFSTAVKNNLLLYDIMTERYEITTILQKEFSMLPEVFGVLQQGTPASPAVTKESVHHFYKYVAGSILTRPAWFFDVNQQGEGIVDVTTHLVDLVQWECFPEHIIDYEKDIKLISARRWPTTISLKQFNAITKLDSFPDYLKKDLVKDTAINVYGNGEINYQIKGVHAKVSVTWAYQAPEGGGDTHYSIMRGSKANLVIRQGPENEYKPTLYIEPIVNEAGYEKTLSEQLKRLQQNYDGIAIKKTDAGWEVTVPEKYREGHEAHFAQVMKRFIEYLGNGNLPEWEVPNMIAKYYTTTKALELAKKSQ
jgi:predicted dehydrogenase